MTEKLHAAYLHETPDGRFEVPRKMKLATMNAQRRWMVELDQEKHQRQLGDKFMANAESAGQTMAFVLQALSYGWQSGHLQVNPDF